MQFFVNSITLVIMVASGLVGVQTYPMQEPYRAWSLFERRLLKCAPTVVDPCLAKKSVQNPVGDLNQSIIHQTLLEYQVLADEYQVLAVDGKKARNRWCCGLEEG